MSRFASTITPERTTNLAGAPAYVQDARTELASILLTSFVQDKFYQSADDEMSRIVELVKADPRFAAKAAVFARNEFGMRTVSHVVAAEVCAAVKGEEWVKFFVESVVRRPDDAIEILAYYMSKYGVSNEKGRKRKIPNSLKKGIGLALGHFDRYQIAKYRGERGQLSLLDVVNITHPRPTERNAEALRLLVLDELRAEDTWEARLSAGEDKATVWRSLLADNRLPYFALLRNLRNIAEVVDDGTFNEALAQLTDPNRIHKSLVLPFRFYTAYKQLGRDMLGKDRLPLVLGALSRAADIAIDNIPDLDGRTLIALDMSQSMTSRRISGRSEAYCADIGALFAAALSRRLAGRSTLLMFDTAVQRLAVNPADSVLTVTDQIRSQMRGGGTNMDLVFDHDDVYDRVIVLSDMQSWASNGAFVNAEAWNYYGRRTINPAEDARNRYCKRTGANPSVITLDLHGYGTMQFPAARCFQLSGWSEKVFDLFPRLEADRGSLVKEVDKVVFGR